MTASLRNVVTVLSRSAITKDTLIEGLGVTVTSRLQECGSLNELRTLHATIIKMNVHKDSYFANQLITAYSRLNRTDLAYMVFAQMPEPNIFLYNAIIGGLVRHRETSKAVRLYVDMLKSDVLPTLHTFSYLVKACVQLSAILLGEMVHGQILKLGFGKQMLVETALVEFYSGFDRINDARKVFDGMPKRDAVSWAVMIVGHMRHGELGLARKLFEEMPERSVASWNAMIAGYARSGDLDSAMSLFKQMLQKNLVSWTTMIYSYSQNRRYKEALETFEQMRAAGINPDQVTLVTVISACAHLGALGVGKELHMYAMINRFDLNAYLGSVLVDMYAKCGNINNSLVVFYKLEDKNLFCWNSIIEGLAVHGRGREAIDMFHRMNQEGKVYPNSVTFVSLLSACNHRGLLEDGRRLFSSMVSDYSFEPQLEHYGCMVDLLGRAGQLQDALQLIHSMKMEPNGVIWGALLSGCKIHGDMAIAKIAAEKLLVLEPNNSSAYLLLINLYAGAKTWERVNMLRGMIMEKGVQKIAAGSSWLEMGGRVHEFAACDLSNISSNVHLILIELSNHLKLEDYSQEWVEYCP